MLAAALPIIGTEDFTQYGYASACMMGKEQHQPTIDLIDGVGGLGLRTMAIAFIGFGYVSRKENHGGTRKPIRT
jgi:hypothetical protein